MSAPFSCEDCGAQMSEQYMCACSFIAPVEDECYNRISNLCPRCRNLKRQDAAKRYPPRPRALIKTRSFSAPPPVDSWAMELFRGARLQDPVVLSDRPIWLYGKGELGEMAHSFFQRVGIEVAGRFEWDESAPLDAQVVVCIVKSAYAPIEKRLSERGFCEVVPFYEVAYPLSDVVPMTNGWAARSEDINLRIMNWVLNQWIDRDSRAHYLQFLAARILGEEWSFEGLEITKDNLFFIPEVVKVLRDHEVFLDCGAYDGEMSGTLLRLSPYSSIVAIEPDDENRARIPSRLRQVVYDFALSDRDSMNVPFAEGLGQYSKLWPTGAARKETRRIDSIDVEPTFIKLHLEGGDLRALWGGSATLFKCRPIVAVRVDKNSDGIWAIPSYLMNILEDYNFYFRSHCWRGAAAAMYAIPRDRR